MATDPRDRTHFIEAVATATDSDAIIKAIAYREYVGRDVSLEPEDTGVSVVAAQKPLPTQVAVAAPAINSSLVRSFTKSASAKQRIKTSIDGFALWVDETKWK